MDGKWMFMYFSMGFLSGIVGFDIVMMYKWMVNLLGYSDYSGDWEYR